MGQETEHLSADRRALRIFELTKLATYPGEAGCCRIDDGGLREIQAVDLAIPVVRRCGRNSVRAPSTGASFVAPPGLVKT